MRWQLDILEPKLQWNQDEELYIEVCKAQRIQAETRRKMDAREVNNVTIVNAVQQVNKTQAISHWASQDYRVRPSWVQWIIKELSVEPQIDCFAKMQNNCLPRWWGPGSAEHEDAFAASWQGKMLWMNPPYDRWMDVVLKLREDQAHAIAVAPRWTTRPWFSELEKMCVRSLFIPKGTVLFMLEGRTCKGTRWDVQAMLVCGHRKKCDIPKVQEQVEIMQVKARSKAAKRKFRRRTLEQARRSTSL